MSSKAEQRKQLALEALAAAEVTDFGEFAGENRVAKGNYDLGFECTRRGYRGWSWVVTITEVDAKQAATVSEINLIATADALLAPPWVPWAERLAEFRKQLRAEGKAKTDAEADELIRDMVGSAHGEQAEEAEADAEQGSVQPPAKTRVRKRLIKREDDNQGDNPEGNSDS